jgi:hypothetical protein
MVLLNGWFLMLILAVSLFAQDKLTAALMAAGMGNILLLLWGYGITNSIDAAVSSANSTARTLSANTLVYSGPELQDAEMSPLEIAFRILLAPDQPHVAYRRGWVDWVPAEAVPEVQFYLRRLKNRMGVELPHLPEPHEETHEEATAAETPKPTPGA